MSKEFLSFRGYQAVQVPDLRGTDWIAGHVVLSLPFAYTDTQLPVCAKVRTGSTTCGSLNFGEMICCFAVAG